MNIVVDKLLVHYQMAGKGKTLVLLHGWGDSLITFDRLRHELQTDYKIIVVDLPGFGQTQPPHAVWDLDAYAQFVQAFLAKLGVKPYAFVAHSNGGSIAIRGLASGILQADKLVLLASAGIRDREKLRRLVLKLIAKVGKLVTFWLPRRYKKALQKQLYGAAGSDMMVAPHLQETFKTTVKQDVQKDATHLQLPTLLVYGANDKATPPLYGEIYQRQIKHSQLVVVDDVTHFLHQEQAEQVARLIKEFL